MQVSCREQAEPGPDSGAELMSICGSDFDTSKPIRFSEFKVADAELQIACGVVNGISQVVSKIGVRFFYVGVRNKYVIIKPLLVSYKNGQVTNVVEISRALPANV